MTFVGALDRFLLVFINQLLIAFHDCLWEKGRVPLVLFNVLSDCKTVHLVPQLCKKLFSLMKLLDIAKLGDHLILLLLALDFLGAVFSTADIIGYFVFVRTLALLLVRHQTPERHIVTEDAILFGLLRRTATSLLFLNYTIPIILLNNRVVFELALNGINRHRVHELIIEQGD